MGMKLLRVDRYDRLSMALHWLSAGAVLLAIALIEFKGVFGKGAGREMIKLAHYQAGALVLALTTMRVVWSLKRARIAPLETETPTDRVLAKIVHGGLYVALLAVPVAGVLSLLAAGKPVVLLGIDLPVWSEGGKTLAKSFKRFHESLANGMLALLFLHVGAALWHRHVRRDAVMHRMLPGG